MDRNHNINNIDCKKVYDSCFSQPFSEMANKENKLCSDILYKCMIREHNEHLRMISKVDRDIAKMKEHLKKNENKD